MHIRRKILKQQSWKKKKNREKKKKWKKKIKYFFFIFVSTNLFVEQVWTRTPSIAVKQPRFLFSKLGFFERDCCQQKMGLSMSFFFVKKKLPGGHSPSLGHFNLLQTSKNAASLQQGLDLTGRQIAPSQRHWNLQTDHLKFECLVELRSQPVQHLELGAWA